MGGPKKNEQDLKGKSRVKEIMEPKTKLAWQILEDDWMAKWGEATDADFDAIKSAKLPLEQREPPKEVLMPLLEYQKEWLAWSMKQEAGSFKGGILAEEISTIKMSQAMISLIVADRVSNQSQLKIDMNTSVASSSNAVYNSGSETEVLPQIKGTLVVSNALSLWHYESSRGTPNGSFKVLVYQGPRRNIDIAEMAEYDIIITSYPLLEVDHRKKVFCKYCEMFFSSDRIAGHQPKCCGNLLSCSEEDLQDKRGKRITTINTSMKRRKIGQAKSNSVLYSVKWGRIILDEANPLKDRRSNTAKAILALQSEYKWALSCRRMENRIDDLYSHIRFLGAHPFSHFFCENCECQSLEHPCPARGERCKCGHFRSQHFSWWKKFVATPIRCHDAAQRRNAMMRLQHQVLSNILSGKTELERQTSNLALPKRTTFIRRHALDSQEQDYYDALYSQCKMEFGMRDRTHFKGRFEIENSALLFAIITRLRQAANHPYLVEYAAPKDSPSFEVCGICHESLEDSVAATGCRHNFCRLCILRYVGGCSELRHPKCPKCPKCAKPLEVDFTGKSSKDAEEGTETKPCERSSFLNQIDLQNFQSSTKIEAVRMETVQMLQEDPSAKAIIFSEFTFMLDLVGFALRKSGIEFVMLDGSMSMTTRDKMIDKFTTDAETKIFLLSFKASIPQNLTVASHVFLIDPCWHPAVEQLALGPVHRLGQHRPVKVIRFVIENTIEEVVLELEETKRLTWKGTVGSYYPFQRYDDLRLLHTHFSSHR